MKKIVINENQRGFLFKNGQYVKLLGAGKYRLLGGKEIEVVQLDRPIISSKCTLDSLLTDKGIADNTSVVDIGDEQLALHFVNGKFKEILRSGKYAFWNVHDTHEFKLVDITATEVDSSVPRYIFSMIPSSSYIKIEVMEYQKAQLFFNRKFVKLLDAGTYYFWKNGVTVDAEIIDTRLLTMNITGQEILTADKVSLRINFVCNYRVTDYVRPITEIDNFEEQIHIAVQLILREYVGRYKLDEILDNKEQMSEFVFEKLKSREKDFFVEITEAGVKDIILPGEIREIMNTVLVAEKRAQANVIARREEVASTRSLLNTAKLMDENQTLYKLKELEYAERIFENVGNITLNGNGNIVEMLTSLIHGDSKQ